MTNELHFTSNGRTIRVLTDKPHIFLMASAWQWTLGWMCEAHEDASLLNVWCSERNGYKNFGRLSHAQMTIWTNQLLKDARS